MGLTKRDEARYIYAEYCRRPQDTRWELIDGIAYATALAPPRRHQGVLGELFRQAANALAG